MLGKFARSIGGSKRGSSGPSKYPDSFVLHTTFRKNHCIRVGNPPPPELLDPPLFNTEH